MTTTQLRLTTTTTTRRPAARVSASLRVVCQAAQPARVSRRNVALALPALSGTPSIAPPRRDAHALGASPTVLRCAAMMFHAPAYALFEAPDDSQYFKDTAALLSTLADASTSRTAVR